MTQESPDTVHGRLLEAVHISGYTFERACGELEWLLADDRWKQVGGGYSDVNAFLSTIDLSEFRIALEQRKKLAKKLQAIEASQRATARLFGVDPMTINRDLRVENATETTQNPNKTDEDKTPIVENSTQPAAWFQTDVDPSKEAKRVAQKEAKPFVRAEKLSEVVWPEGKHGVILADPPWKPDAGLLDPTRQIENQYPTLAVEELIALAPRVKKLAADNCVLLMWITVQKMAEAVSVIDAWGFTVKSGAVWIKPSVGMGYWFRARHELIVLATRGAPMTPLEADRPDSVILADRRGHSEKPDQVYDLIERMFPTVPKVEIFARAERDGWTPVTNELSLRSA